MPKLKIRIKIKGFDHKVVDQSAQQIVETVEHLRTQQLHRHIFEGEGGAVKQFQHELIVADLHQRADHIMPETGIGLIDHGTEICGRNVGGIGAEDSARNRLVRLSRKACDLSLFQRDKMLGPIKPAIPGKTGQNSIGKTKGRGQAAGGNIAHGFKVL